VRKIVARQQQALAGHEAGRLLGSARAAEHPLVVEVLDGWDAAGLKAIASSMTAQSSVAVALFTTPAPAFAVVARSPSLAVDAAAVLGQLTARFGGRGGGKADLAQAGGLTGSLDDMCAAAKTLLGG
jgi:alanyl-tRNA synthetase